MWPGQVAAGSVLCGWAVEQDRWLCSSQELFKLDCDVILL